MSVLKVMSRQHGHKTLEWDVKEDLDSQRVDLAREEFEQLVNGEGFIAYNVVDTQTREVEVLKRDQEGKVPFDPQAEEILVAAPLQGGC